MDAPMASGHASICPVLRRDSGGTSAPWWVTSNGGRGSVINVCLDRGVRRLRSGRSRSRPVEVSHGAEAQNAGDDRADPDGL